MASLRFPIPMRVLLVPLVLLATLSASAQGRMAFDADAHDFGRLSEEEPGRHTFRFTNVGDAPLSLVGVESTCGCTVPEFTPSAVAPGEAGVVVVRYDTAGRPGPFESAVRVTADGAEPQDAVLRISGVVRPALATSGTRVGALAFETLDKDLGTLAPGSALQTSIRFANAGERPVRVERVEAGPGVEVVFPRGPVFPDHLGGVFVTVEEPARWAAGGGEVEVPLVLYTSDPDEPVKRLVVRAVLSE